MAGNLSVDDIAVVANAVFSQSLGNAAAAVNYSDFVACADLTLKSGNYDPFNTALQQVLSRTIFSIRPYNAKFNALMKDDIRWGNHVRKLQVLEGEPVQTDGSFFTANGAELVDTMDEHPDGIVDGVDQWKIKAPAVLQTNFYGQQTYQKHLTVWVDQLNTALSGPGEFGNFLTMVMTHATDQLEQTREGMRRGTLLNLIGGTIANAQTAQVRHLLTEYNAATGLTLTATTVMQPTNYKAFIQWAYSIIADASNRLTDRTQIYHVNPVKDQKDLIIARHTDKEMQNLFLLSKFALQSEMMALADIFHDGKVSIGSYETVNYWQTAAAPETINGTVNRLAPGGSAITTGTVNNSTVIGVLFDDEAAGVNLTRQHATNTPINAKGLYTNYYWTETARFWNDNTENVVVFCLD